MKKIYFLLSFISIAFTGFTQGTESFTNQPAASSAYTLRTWTGDNSLTWNAANGRTDGTTAVSAVTGMTFPLMIVRNTAGIISCNGIPNGCGNISFKYAKAFTAAGNIPTFGVFINGTQYGTTTTASSNAATTFSVAVGVSGSFDLEIRQLTANDQGRLAVDDILWTAFGGAACTEPATQPTGLGFTQTSNSITGSFTATAADGYLTVRTAAPATLSTVPTDGQSYTAGSAFSNGIVVASGNSTSFTDNGLSPSTGYNYYIFSYNNICTGGPDYNTNSPLQGNDVTDALGGCSTPATPTALSLNPSNTAISGSFTGSGANAYLVIMSTGAPYNSNVLNGQTYPNGPIAGTNGTVISNSPATSFSAGGLTVSTQYFFTVYAMNTGCAGEPFYSASGLNGNATTTNVASGIPPGYYNAAAGLTCGPLKDALSNIITTGQVTLSYSALDDTQMPIADTIRSDDQARSVIWDIYSNNTAGNEPFEFNSSQNPSGGFCGGTTPGSAGICWNKEHTFPQSWFGGLSPTVADLFVVRPTDATINSKRMNIPYSVVGGSTTYTFPATTGTYPGVPILDKVGPSTAPGVSVTSAFEPSDGVKGDIARDYFYILTRYQNNLSSWVSSNPGSGIATVVDGTTGGGTYPSFQLPYLTMMYNWHLADPVDAREINYNNLVYSQQNNRNPYIDHPEYVAQVFQCTGVLPVTLIDFTAQLYKTSALLRWNATFEAAFKRFDVERSINGIAFNKIGEVAGQNLGNYNFTDNDLPEAAVIYYRLKMIDLDGKFKYSKIVSVQPGSSGVKAVVYPNPAAGELNIKMIDKLQANSTLQITDITGRIVKQQPVNSTETVIRTDIKALPSGRYFIKITNSKQVINQSFVVIR